MLDNLLKAGSTFDWISPTIAFIQDWYNGPAVSFTVALEAGWSTDAIQAVLASKGIKVWGLMLVGDRIIFRVRHTQARYAQYLLEREGITYQGDLDDSLKSTGSRQKENSKPKIPSESLFDEFLNHINRFIDNL